LITPWAVAHPPHARKVFEVGVGGETFFTFFSFREKRKEGKRKAPQRLTAQ
jgi:hypothetical protein